MRHQILAGLFQRRGEIAIELLAHCADVRFEHHCVAPRPSDLSQVVSTEYRADAVIELRDRKDAIVAAIVVEIQLGRDEEKRYTWPLYVAALRAQLRCPVVLLVITQSRSVARWARKAIALGHAGFQLAPVVIDFPEVPRIVDPAYATKLPELAVLSAIAHPEFAVADAAIHAVTTLPGEQAGLYSDVIMAALPDALRQRLEVRMEGYVYRSPFARKYFNAGRKEGRQEGRNEGRQEGRSEGLDAGREEGLRRAVLALAKAKISTLKRGEAAAIGKLQEERLLTELIGALVRATTARQARAVLKAATAGRRRT